MSPKRPVGYYRFPTLHAETVVFACEDDLWTVAATGGIARRLTSNLAEATRPSLSPDGRQLAFVGREEGQSEIYIMPAEGGAASRLTYLSSSFCQTAGWTPDAQLIFASSFEHWYYRFCHLYTLDDQNRQPQRLKVGRAHSIAFGPTGGVVIGRNTDDLARRKRYRGGAAGKLWIDPTGNGDFNLLLDIAGNVTAPMWLNLAGASGGRIFFISDHEGIGNIYSCLPNGSDLQRHSDHNDFYARNASSDGQRIVYHAGGDLFIYDPSTGHDQRINIEYYSPQTQRNRKFADGSRFLNEYALHPSGQAVAITTRGKIFTFPNWEGPVIQHEQPVVESDKPITAVRYRLPQWLPDGERLIAVSDASGEEAFVILHGDGSEEPETINDLDIGRPINIVVNPIKNQILFSNHRYELMFLDLDTHQLQRIDRGVAKGISGFCWSPDGEWAAYSVSLSLQTDGLKLWKAVSNEAFTITQPVLKDLAPSFDPKGRYLYFLSYRTFEPISDRLQTDLIFPLGMKPYLITLQKDTPSPFIPHPPELDDIQEDDENEKPDHSEAKSDPAANDATKPEGEPEGKTEASPEEEKQSLRKVKPITIDLDGLEKRILAFPVPEGIYGSIVGSDDGSALYTRMNADNDETEGKENTSGALLVYNFRDQHEETLVYGINDFAISESGKFIIYRQHNRLRVLKAGYKPPNNGEGSGRKSGWLDLGRVRVSISPGAEWRQMFREAWRLQRDQFWTPDMSQVDWIAIHDRYLPLVDRVSSRGEFSDIMWEMQGELSTSHAYEYGGDYRHEPSYNQGFLGADFEFDSQQNAWRFSRILHGDPWNPDKDSPLNSPGVNIKAGDHLYAIDGVRLSAKYSPQEALVNDAGSEITLTVEDTSPPEADDHAKSDETPVTPSTSDKETRPATRVVIVKTLYSDSQIRYRQWVNDNRSRVHEASDGRIGYIHIPDMGSNGYAEFHRGYLAEFNHQGLIIDVRFNLGGFVSHLLLEKLARRRIGYDSSRWSQIPDPYPPQSVAGPMVTITNELAGSDGNIFSHGFKLMKLGSLIGTRTWGGVIGIEIGQRLVDGSLITQPEYSFWFSDVGLGLENYGTEPDIEVDILPQDYERGVDTQLERALQEILNTLQENPPQLPVFEPRPNHALPKLPPR